MHVSFSTAIVDRVYNRIPCEVSFECWNFLLLQWFNLFVLYLIFMFICVQTFFLHFSLFNIRYQCNIIAFSPVFEFKETQIEQKNDVYTQSKRTIQQNYLIDKIYIIFWGKFILIYQATITKKKPNKIGNVNRWRCDKRNRVWPNEMNK